MPNEEYSLTVVNGTELTLTLSGPAGPAGPNTITTATTTNLTGFLSGNGATVTASTSATLVSGSAANFASGSQANFASGSSAFFASGSQAFFDVGSSAYFSITSEAIFETGCTASFANGTIKLEGTLFTSSLNFVDWTSAKTITLPDATGTVALLNPSSGTQSFTGQVLITGQNADSANSAMTRVLGDARYGAIGLAGTSAISITNQTTPQTIQSASLAVGLYHVRMVFSLNGTANTGTRHGYNFSGTATFRFLRSRASSATYTQVTSNPFDIGLAESATSSLIEGIISVTATGTFSMQAAQNTSHADTLSVVASTYMIITPCPNGSIS